MWGGAYVSWRAEVRRCGEGSCVAWCVKVGRYGAVLVWFDGRRCAWAGRLVSRNAIKKDRERAEVSSGEGGAQQRRVRSSAVEGAGQLRYRA